MGDYIGECYRACQGDTWSLDWPRWRDHEQGVQGVALRSCPALPTPISISSAV